MPLPIDGTRQVVGSGWEEGFVFREGPGAPDGSNLSGRRRIYTHNPSGGPDALPEGGMAVYGSMGWLITEHTTTRRGLARGVQPTLRGPRTLELLFLFLNFCVSNRLSKSGRNI